MIVTKDGNAVHVSGRFRIVDAGELNRANVDAMFAFPDPHNMQPLCVVRVNNEYVAAPMALILRVLSASLPKSQPKVLVNDTVNA